MKRRLFIAVNAPEDIKEKIAETIEEIKYNFGEKTRFVSKDNWHFTLIFLGYQDETKIPAIEKALAEFAAKEKPGKPKASISKLTYGPLEGLAKRMIWFTADSASSAELGKIRGLLTDHLLTNGVRWQIDNRPFDYAHITLARFKPKNVRELPPIEKKLSWPFSINTVDLMESHLRRDGPVYEKIAGVAIK